MPRLDPAGFDSVEFDPVKSVPPELDPAKLDPVKSVPARAVPKTDAFEAPSAMKGGLPVARGIVPAPVRGKRPA